MYGDTTYGDNDTSWMNESPAPPASAAQPKQAQAVSNEPSWMRGDPAPDQTSGAFGQSTAFNDEETVGGGGDGGGDGGDDGGGDGGGWSDVASNRYQGSDNPDWMKSASRRTTTNSGAGSSGKNDAPAVDNEFGTGIYRKEEVRFDGDDEDYHSRKKVGSSIQRDGLDTSLLSSGSSRSKTNEATR
jgi:hypothetical protein